MKLGKFLQDLTKISCQKIRQYSGLNLVSFLPEFFQDFNSIAWIYLPDLAMFLEDF